MTALLDAARDLFETLDAEAAIAEEAGTPMTDRAVALCRDAGLYGTMITRDAGGAELTIGESLDVFKELARADGSTGWVVTSKDIKRREIDPNDRRLLRHCNLRMGAKRCSVMALATSSSNGLASPVTPKVPGKV